MSDSLYNLEPEEDSGRKESLLRPFLILIKIMSIPIEGWKTLKRSHYSSEYFNFRTLYPLILVAALSEFLRLCYGTETSLTLVCISGICVFTSFFFGYFTIIAIGGMFLRKNERGILATPFGREYVSVSMSTLTIFYIFYNLLPMLEPIVMLLPFWTIYIAVRGTKVLRIPDQHRISTAGMLSAIIIGAPIFWYWILDILLSSNSTGT